MEWNGMEWSMLRIVIMKVIVKSSHSEGDIISYSLSNFMFETITTFRPLS